MTTSLDPSPPNPRQDRSLALIAQLLKCDNGEEPAILNAEIDLLDAEFVRILMQTASYFAHQDNPESARFLVFIAREHSRQLGLYSQSTGSQSTGSQSTELDPQFSPDASPQSSSKSEAEQTARPGVL
ncbi:MAG: hypothetical protein ACFB16_25140 [Phormidesmis sp.]